LELLADLVHIESPSDDKVAVDTVVGYLTETARLAGWRVRRHRQKGHGDCLELRIGPERSPQKPLLLLGHLDTVWPKGTLAKMPFKVEKKRAWGPGVLDMKAGVVIGFEAVRLLREQNALTRPVCMLLVGDEEIGSPASRPLTEKIAQQCEAVYVLEPAQGLDGAYKTARKGVGQYRLQVEGVASHSGVDFERGHSAVLELARQIEAINNFVEPDRGLMLNPGVIGGGTLSNVVAAQAWAEIDVRIARAADGARIDRRLRSLRSQDKACKLTWSGGMNRPPMERTRATAALFERARLLAAQIGLTLEEAATGGGSDGNFTSALGVPTLDGMGAVGEGAHARNESILLEHLAPRTALLAAMLSAQK
jgi:glutamate carboxypeptidase